MESFDHLTKGVAEDQYKPQNIRSKGFTQVSNKLLVPNGLDAYEKMVEIILKKHKMKNRYCWPSIKTIAEGVGCSESTVKKKIKSLNSKKWLGKTKSNKYKSNIYQIPI